jgi:DNA-binding transcriptional ArsR family regulator
VSHHLKVLTDAGLVTGTREGRNIWYAAVPAVLGALRIALGSHA